MIKMIITDVDGVLTSGKIYMNSHKEILKSYCLKDMDAVHELKSQGYRFGIITGEDNYYTSFIKEQMQPDYFYTSCKNKWDTIYEILQKENLNPTELCYIGDGKYDLDIFAYIKMSICPIDAIPEVCSIASYVLNSKGGEGCLWEALSYINRFNAKFVKKDMIMIHNIIEQHENIVKTIQLEETLFNSISDAIYLIYKVFLNNGQLLLCGNGGSAADAQHIAAEFVGRFYQERKALNAEALNGNTSSLTAISNDYTFNEIFSRQIEAKGKAGDALIAISTSGTSSNILEALKKARSVGMYTIALTGNNTSQLQKYADILIGVPSNITPRIQEMHIMIGHIICENVEKLLCEN